MFRLLVGYQPAWMPRPEVAETIQGYSSYEYVNILDCASSVSTCPWTSDLIFFNTTYWQADSGIYEPLKLSDLVYFDPTITSCIMTDVTCSNCHNEISFSSTVLTPGGVTTLADYHFTWSDASAPSPTDSYKLSL